MSYTQAQPGCLAHSVKKRARGSGLGFGRAIAGCGGSTIGARMEAAVRSASENESPGALIELTNKNDTEHWVGLQNFYAITRYNHSKLYAMAVYQLAREISDRYRVARAN